MQCRVCMHTQCNILLDMSHSSSEEGKTLFDCFNECTQLNATASDTFPSMLCKICVQKMQIAYNFRKCALQSNEHFKKLWKSKQVESESHNITTKEMYVYEELEENIGDPLDMDFNEALGALKESAVEFKPEGSSMNGSPCNFLEESEVSIKEGNQKYIYYKSEIEINLTTELDNVNPDQNTIEKESENDEFFGDEYENETEPIEKYRYACEICKGSFTIKADLRKHIAKNHKSAIICVTCSKVFDMPDELRIHKKLIHDTDSPVQCDFCMDKPIMPRSEIPTHFKEHHSSRYFKYFPRLRIKRGIDSGEPATYKCKYCWKNFPTAFELEDHVKTHVFRCPFCEKNFNRIRTYYNHVKRLHNCSASSYPPTPFAVYGPDTEDDKPIYCKACNKTYLRLGSYNRHIKQKHRKITLENDIEKGYLEKEKTAVEPLGIHLQIEPIFDSPELSRVYVGKLPEIMSEQKLSKFQHCPTKMGETNNITTTNPEEYIEILEVSDIDESQDETAETILSEEENLKSGHEGLQNSLVVTTRKKSKHSKFKKKNEYLCSFCPQVLSSRTTLEKHENNKHLNARTREECPICNKKLKPSYISTHINTVHTGERNYTCDICEDSYKTKNQLKRHKLLHDKDRGLPCTVCDRKFTERSELNVHMRLHTGELPYACHLCDRRFRIKVRLTYHLQHHANVKKKCKYCDKEFRNGTSLRKHSYEHTGKFPYRCTICDYRHVNREYFCKHMLNKHGKAMTADELFAMFKANTGRNPFVKKVQDLDNTNMDS